jgi:hypothetical protein
MPATVPPIDTWPARGRRAAIFVTACLGLFGAAANAQTLPGGTQLGMTVPQLQQAVPALKPVARPARLTGGLVGNWSAPPIDIAGIALTPTFFFADAQLRRVEYLALPQAGTGAFDTLLAWGRTFWGQELASRNPEGAYASWTPGETDVYLQQTGEAAHPQVRLVVKRRVMKDASEL